MNNTVDYYRKYLKYYRKYGELKQQFGGAKCEKCGSDEHNTDDCPQNSEEWTTVSQKPKQKSKKPITVPNPIIKRNREEVMEILNYVLSRYKKHIEAGYLYGSRAQGTNRPDSDADVIVFWRRLPSIEELKNIRAEIETLLGFEIDLVSCWYVKEYIEYNDIRDKAYFDGVIAVAKQFIGEQMSIQYYTETSVKQPKLGRP